MSNPFENPFLNNPVEKKEEQEKYGEAKFYINKKVEFLSNYPDKDETTEESINAWQEAVANLEMGQELETMKTLENIPKPPKEELSEWRKAIFEISNDKLTNGHFLSKNQVAGILDKEFEKKQQEMNSELDKNPRDYNQKDKKEWSRQVLNWKDASNELLTYERSENALVLLEQDISDLIDHTDSLKERLKNNPADKETRQMLEEKTKKMAEFRRTRDSLYSIDFSKSGI